MEKRLRHFEPQATIKTFMFIPNGEIDLFMLLKDTVHDYEIKRSRHLKSEIKGFRQLSNQKDFWLSQGVKDVRSYFVYGVSDWNYKVDEVTQFEPRNSVTLVSYKIGRGYKL